MPNRIDVCPIIFERPFLIKPNNFFGMTVSKPFINDIVPRHFIKPRNPEDDPNFILLQRPPIPRNFHF